MQSKVESEVKTFCQDLSKFTSRWQQLKPKDDILEGDMQACANALASLKERRTEFNELVLAAKKLK